MMYELMVFKEGIVIDNNLHGEICNPILTQMSGCNILFNHNLWFKIIGIKTK